ncbi:hypothetical protein K469DRAFT_705446 [Zopfia rhizophila CBS 207.26]|uniref:Uncharacterized protein n=1 Tax=Zopfia rhizophila CBS 207.26 TaxID=1314779 RepID=A0A6A6E7C9_9PEZI|nr:hypothetical protein K469DRAFT_705446 [Zopfia rhizophila CBS 207.26]
MPDPTPTDDALLARLNALKKSSVSFDTTVSASISNPSPNAPSTPVDDLAARFMRLGSASPSESPKPSRTSSAQNAHENTEGKVEGNKRTPVMAPGAPSYLEGIAEGVGGGGEVEFNEEDDKTLDQLLQELGPQEKWNISRTEETDVNKMLKEVKTILPQVCRESLRGSDAEGRGKSEGGEEEREKLTDWENLEVDTGSGGVRAGREAGSEGEGKERSEEQEAEEVIARVLAELEISRKCGGGWEDRDSGDAAEREESEDKGLVSRIEGNTESDKKEGSEEEGLQLPSAPTSIPEDDLDKTQALEDALVARLSALSPNSKSSFSLPAAPSFSPSKKPPKVTSSLPKYTDEEIDSWCVICNEDATLKCLGCDSDLYCQNCWVEGHRGVSAGFEERRHRAVIYNRSKKQEKVQAAG